MSTDNLEQYLKEVQDRVNVTPENAVAERQLSKEKFSFSRQSLSEQLVIWDYIWNNTPDSRTRSQSFLFLESHIKDRKFLLDSWEVIKHWQKKVDEWWNCDALSKIYTKILEIIPDSVSELLARWNKSANQWERRQSIVCLLYFSRTKKVFLPFGTIINLIDNLLEDKEYYVQKAVGWSLKELYLVYSSETIQYLNKNIERVSAIAFTAATGKLKKEDKERLKRIRKSNRRQQQANKSGD